MPHRAFVYHASCTMPIFRAPAVLFKTKSIIITHLFSLFFFICFTSIPDTLQTGQALSPCPEIGLFVNRLQLVHLYLPLTKVFSTNLAAALKYGCFGSFFQSSSLIHPHASFLVYFYFYLCIASKISPVYVPLFLNAIL